MCGTYKDFKYGIEWEIRLNMEIEKKINQIDFRRIFNRINSSIDHNFRIDSLYSKFHAHSPLKRKN